MFQDAAVLPNSLTETFLQLSQGLLSTFVQDRFKQMRCEAHMLLNPNICEALKKLFCLSRSKRTNEISSLTEEPVGDSVRLHTTRVSPPCGEP